ncbi:MAG: ATP-binding protein, partial [Candidatus Omnitrophica bacterium]|nr:ATP-binding protein [Candidatus Omnitrophota bacterium]
MGKVNFLPEEVISKIAGGEVVESPASVLKELIENSIDAYSKKIEIKIENSGKKLIIVKDDGEGIAPDDIDKIFERYSTSKIKTKQDLFNIKTLGFRGEALYSI